VGECWSHAPGVESGGVSDARILTLLYEASLLSATFAWGTSSVSGTEDKLRKNSTLYTIRLARYRRRLDDNRSLPPR
jgi:hypothetical protein